MRLHPRLQARNRAGTSSVARHGGAGARKQSTPHLHHIKWVDHHCRDHCCAGRGSSPLMERQAA